MYAENDVAKELGKPVLVLYVGPFVIEHIFALIVIHVDREKDLRLDDAYDKRRIDVICHVISSVERTGTPSGS